VVPVALQEKPQDRERAIDAGTNDYLVKSRFDQRNLLQAVRRLI